MKKRLLAFSAFLLILGSNLNAGTDNGFSSDASIVTSHPLLYRSGASSYDGCLLFRLGVMSCDIQRLNDAMQATYGKQFGYNLPMVGISYYRPLPIAGNSFDFNIDGSYLIPQKLSNGAYSTSLSGFSAAVGLGKDLFTHNKQFDLILSVGFQGGLLMLKSVSNSTETNSKYFFAPQLTLFPKWNLGSFSIGVRGSYHFDALNGAWSGTNGGYVPVCYATGYSIELALGLIFGN
jgi:hypothetical protein